MSPRVFQDGDLVYWFHSYDVVYEERASIHVGKGSQNDSTDAKIWLEPQIEIARTGRSLSRNELTKALRTVEEHWDRLLEAWHGHRRRTN